MQKLSFGNALGECAYVAVVLTKPVLDENAFDGPGLGACHRRHAAFFGSSSRPRSSRLALGLIGVPSAALCSAVFASIGVARAFAQASVTPQMYMGFLPHLLKGGPPPRHARFARVPGAIG